MKRKFYTQADIEQLSAQGINELLVDEHDVVLELAREEAERSGISIIFKSSVETIPQKRGDALVKPPYDMQAWRKQFPILEDGIHLANCSQSPQSIHSRKTIEGYLDNWNEMGMNWEEWVEASALDYSGRRNKVVVTEAEFPTVIHIWTASKRLGFELEFVPLTNGEINLADYERIIDERTLIVCIPQVYYQNGFKQDIAPICQIAHKKGALLYVDAYQCLGTDPVDVKALDIDILSTGNLKYLLGLPGSAYLYVKKEITPYLKPMATGWFGQENPFAFDIHNFQYASDGRRFDTGTPSIITAYTAKAGMEIINEVGVPNIKMWTDELSRYTIQELDKRGLETTSPREISKKGPTTAIVVPDPHAVENELKKRKIVASARGPIIRFAPHFFVTHEDIDRALDNLEEILKDMGSR